MSTIRMCRIPYAKTCTTWRIGGALPYAFADLCTDICPDMHKSPDAGRRLRYAASSPGLRRPRHTERSECHGVMPVFGAFRRIVYATAYRTDRAPNAGSIPRSTAAHTVFNNRNPASGRDIIPLFGIRGTGHGRRPASHTFNGCYSHRSFPPTASKMNISMTALIPRMPNIRRLLRRVGREARLETWRSANRASLMRSHSVVAAIAVHIH